MGRGVLQQAVHMVPQAAWAVQSRSELYWRPRRAWLASWMQRLYWRSSSTSWLTVSHGLCWIMLSQGADGQRARGLGPEMLCWQAYGQRDCG